MKHRFYKHKVMRPSRKQGKRTKSIRAGARKPGSMDQGSIRRPF